MKTFLAVNIAPLDLNTITTLLTEHTLDFKILTTKKIGEVDEIIKALNPDVIIIDLVTPSPRDLKILDSLSKGHPKLPLFVLTAFETGEIRSAIKAVGTLRYFEKPIDFKTLVDVIWQKLERKAGGQVKGISLTSFLQMSEMEKTSCSLKVTAEKKSGMIYLLKGALITAETGKLKNEQAVFDILSWDNPTIEIGEPPTDIAKEIETPLISLLMESARRKDEKRGKKKPAIEPVDTALKKAGKKAPPPKKAKGKAAVAEKAEEKPPEPEIVPEQLKELEAAGKLTDASKVVKRRRIIKYATRSLTAVLLVIALACLWQYVLSPWLAQRTLNHVLADAKAAPSIEEKITILDNYLASGPENQYADSAEAMKRTYAGEVEDLAFQRALRAVEGLPLDEKFEETAKAAYLKFIKEFPDSSHKAEIEQRIEALPSVVADTEYEKLKEIPDHHYSQRLKAYRSFLAKYPDSTQADDVRVLMSSLGEALFDYIQSEKAGCDKDQNWQQCIKLCEYFEDNFEGHQRLDDITTLKNAMIGQGAYLKIAEDLEKAGPFSSSAEKILKDYLKKYPESPACDRVREQLARINQDKNQETVWQQLMNYVQNDRNSIFDRVDRMGSYLSGQPPEHHLKEAGKIYAWLLKEKESALKQIKYQAEAENRQKRQKTIIEQEKKRVINQIRRSGGDRYTIKSEDTITDSETGLTWCMLDSSVMTTSRCLDYKAAQQYVAKLTTGGYTDWRLPDPDELLILYNSSPAFPVGNARLYWTADVFYAAWTEKNNAVVQSDTGIWKKTETDLDKCGAVRAVRP